MAASLAMLIADEKTFNAVAPDPPWKYGDPGNRGGVGISIA